MYRRRHSRRRSAEAAELDMTTFLNLMVVLVPFLLIGAVFSRITIIELNLPSANGSAEVVEEPPFRVYRLDVPDPPADGGVPASGRSAARHQGSQAEERSE